MTRQEVLVVIRSDQPVSVEVRRPKVSRQRSLEQRTPITEPFDKDTSLAESFWRRNFASLFPGGYIIWERSRGAKADIISGGMNDGGGLEMEMITVDHRMEECFRSARGNIKNQKLVEAMKKSGQRLVTENDYDLASIQEYEESRVDLLADVQGLTDTTRSQLKALIRQTKFEISA